MKKNVTTLGQTLASLKAKFLGASAEVEEEEGPEANTDKVDSDGDEPEGDEPEGDEPEGDEPEGDEPEGDEPEGDEPEGDEPESSSDDKANAGSDDEMVSISKTELTQIMAAAQQWEANEGRFNTLVKWEASMSDAGAGIKGGDASNNSGKKERVSRTTARAQKIYDKRVNRSGKGKD